MYYMIQFIKNSKGEQILWKKKIYAILTDIRPEFDFKESDNFVEDGFLDSFDVVTLVSEIEEKFDVIVDGMDVMPENFETVAAICELIERSDKKA